MFLRLKTEAGVLKYRFAYMGGIMEFFTIGKRFWQINLGKCFPLTKEKLCSDKGYTLPRYEREKQEGGGLTEQRGTTHM